MAVVRSLADLDGPDADKSHVAGPDRLVVLAAASDHQLIERAITVLGFAPAVAARIRGDLSHRPSVEMSDPAGEGQVLLSVGLVDHDVYLIPLLVAIGPHGVLIVARDPDVVSDVADSLVSAGDPVTATLVQIARHSEDSIGALATELHDPDDAVAGHLRGLSRKEVLAERDRLNTIVDVFDAQQQLASRDGDLAHLPGVDAGALRSTSSHFGYCSNFAGRLYDLIGDALSQRSSVVSERLTMVNAIFLPLTLAASFFGMNFEWLTSHIQSGPAFVVLGFLVPALLAAITYVALRRFVR